MFYILWFFAAFSWFYGYKGCELTKKVGFKLKIFIILQKSRKIEKISKFLPQTSYQLFILPLPHVHNPVTFPSSLHLTFLMVTVLNLGALPTQHHIFNSSSKFTHVCDLWEWNQINCWLLFVMLLRLNMNFWIVVGIECIFCARLNV